MGLLQLRGEKPLAQGQGENPLHLASLLPRESVCLAGLCAMGRWTAIAQSFTTGPQPLGGLGSVPTKVVSLCGKSTTMTAATYWSRVKNAPVALGERGLPKATSYRSEVRGKPPASRSQNQQRHQDLSLDSR